MDNKLNELLGIIEGTQISADGLQSLLRIQSANTKMEMMEMLTKSAIESKNVDILMFVSLFVEGITYE